jgi:hypothetical protein
MKKRRQEASSTINEIPSNHKFNTKTTLYILFHAVTIASNKKRKTRDDIGMQMVRQDQQESEVVRK